MTRSLPPLAPRRSMMNWPSRRQVVVRDADALAEVVLVGEERRGFPKAGSAPEASIVTATMGYQHTQPARSTSMRPGGRALTARH
jgi:hypothetical protein